LAIGDAAGFLSPEPGYHGVNPVSLAWKKL